MNISVSNKYLKIFWASLILFSCTERIDIHTDSQEFARLVVEGSISTDTTAHMVKLTTTADYFDDRPPRPVSGAQVTIVSETDSFLLSETLLNRVFILLNLTFLEKLAKNTGCRFNWKKKLAVQEILKHHQRFFPLIRSTPLLCNLMRNGATRDLWRSNATFGTRQPKTFTCFIPILTGN